MRPRASQVARIRFVETEEDVETYRPALDASKDAIGDRRSWQWTRTMASACRCTGLTPLTLSGGR